MAHIIDKNNYDENKEAFGKEWVGFLLHEKQLSQMPTNT